MTSLGGVADQNKAPTWLRLIAVIGVVWYAFGLAQFWFAFSMNTQLAISSGEISAAHGTAIDATPLLIWITFAIASAAGLIGSFYLFLASSNAKQVFALSLASAALYYLWVYVLSGTGAGRPSEELVIAGVVGAVTFGFYLLSRRIQ